jgi:hypothetical protein
MSDDKDSKIDENIIDTTELGGTQKENEYYGFLQTISSNYGYTLLFLFIIIGLIFLLQYAQKRLNFPESKMIINWFGFIIVMNVIITYGTIMMYKQVKNQKGYVGTKGVQGPIGEQGYSDFCDQCAKEIKTVQPIFAEEKIRQPILPEEINTEPEGIDNEEEDETPRDDAYELSDEREKEDKT